ncbi:MAG TPA: winged helix-turn-helix domain-containing protein [Alphaproteobacteria bacterium]|nr:winged helix-turn-helix domain-containing protein [Alphaproteobacteria bacterium]
MDIAIISENKTLISAFKEGFLVLDLELTPYASWAEYSSSSQFEGVCLVEGGSQINKMKVKSEKTAYFAIIDDKADDLGEKSSLFSKKYPKPFRMGVIIDDIRHYLIRKKQLSALKPVKMGKFTLDPLSSVLKHQKTDQIFKLTEKELDILIYLHTHQKKDVTKQDLLDQVWGYAENVETHTLETHIYRLRQKIESDPARPEFLVTSGEGYRLNF